MVGDFFFQAEDGIRYLVRSRGLGDVYKRQVMDVRSRSSTVWVVFDEGEGRDLQRIFDVLAGFVTRTLEKSIGFLGALVHDESLEHSIRDEKPLVLLSRPSAASEALTGICSRFMDGRQQKAGETPS